ncbi:probable inactive peptidyl-prolyl cis-trans isomerase-like 6 [Sitophilus oryzae]|uniref:Probable inactive peptidyl-prolyl cis-trans isomerase-like 6 n=1 Tax=Sitophilus oryzae TaxID=7048 RepID=A0A6J2XM71_SITOR|nr:probable inactive peptidyl-prolyl cis-trans isomerase-like 6 [Sitophilus oryzae]
MSEKDEETVPQKFLVVGIVTSEDFQKCRFAVTKLYNSFPKEFESPEIRPMLDVEWNDFIKKQQRRLGNGLWAVKNCVAMFINNQFLGDFDDLFRFIWKKWRFVFNQDWSVLATNHLVAYLEEKAENYRQFVYLTIAINKQVIGSLLFELYNDLVPLTCENFLNRCNDDENGYLGAPVHRIVLRSWIQCGGYDLTPKKKSCENYVVPHDRRGVLSMCNNGRHKDNSTQFFISLGNTPWMDYKYVAFGQLIQGDDVLKEIEKVPTYYQAPTKDIMIVKCGEFKTRFASVPEHSLLRMKLPEEIKEPMNILSYIKKYHEVIGPESDNIVPGPAPLPILRLSCETLWSKRKLLAGGYTLSKDLISYWPFKHLPPDDSDEGLEDYNICEPTFKNIVYSKNMCYPDDTDSTISNITI